MKALFLYFGTAFILHLLWENLQAPLYTCFSGNSFLQCFLVCLRAAATGDMLFMLTIYGALALVHQDFYWIADRSVYSHPATWLLPVLIGVLLAVSFELWAVYVAERWQYAAFMPILPVLRIGLTPILQMIAISIATLCISFRFARLKKAMCQSLRPPCLPMISTASSRNSRSREQL
jgi:hypothetical protein